MANELDVAGQRALVVGAARSGLAAARLLLSRGAMVTLTDRRQDVPGVREIEAEGVALEMGGHRPSSFERADLIVTSPGVPPELPPLVEARRRGVRVIGEVELASRWLRGPLIAITGTKGKSTTTTLVGRMLEEAGRRVLVGGNIGVPLSTQVDSSTDDTVHVVEVSSFQLEATDTFHPWIAALLNFSPDHLDRHADEGTYARAKARVFANQDGGDWAVVNADNRAALTLAAESRARVVRYGIERAPGVTVFVRDNFIWHETSEGEVALAPVAAVRLPGTHSLSNVLAASTISRLAGVAPDALTRALDGFTGLEHVMEPAGSLHGVEFINDSKATNIEAAARSIESFDRVVAIIGGRFKGGRFEDLRDPLVRRGLAVVAIGEARARVRQALEDVVTVVDATDMADAVRRGWQLARPSGVVVLAPACASFDMFADYAERGRCFKDEVRRLIARRGDAGEP